MLQETAGFVRSSLTARRCLQEQSPVGWVEMTALSAPQLPACQTQSVLWALIKQRAWGILIRMSLMEYHVAVFISHLGSLLYIYRWAFPTYLGTDFYHLLLLCIHREENTSMVSGLWYIWNFFTFRVTLLNHFLQNILFLNNYKSVRSYSVQSRSPRFLSGAANIAEGIIKPRKSALSPF